MKRSYVMFGLFCMVLTGIVFGFYFFALAKAKNEQQEVAVTWKQLPEPVCKTIQAQLGNEPYAGISMEKEAGAIIYSAEKEIDAHTKIIRISDNGQLLEVYEDISAADLPDAVKSVVKKKLPQGGKKEVRRVTCYYYEIEERETKNNTVVRLLGNGKSYDDEN